MGLLIELFFILIGNFMYKFIFDFYDVCCIDNYINYLENEKGMCIRKCIYKLIVWDEIYILLLIVWN